MTLSTTQPVAPIDLGTHQQLHVVGVAGPGMSAIAIVLAQMGHSVSGTDLREQPVLDRLRAAGVAVHIGHDRAYVHGVDAVTASTAIPAKNIELDEARRKGVLVLRRAGMLAGICARARSLGVAGTHGKTTTSSMLMLVMSDAGLKPSFVIGGDVTDMGTGAQWTGSDWFVVEADESDGTHLELPLHGTIITNIETDHLDHYGTFANIVDGFDTYLAQISGPKVLCSDDARCVVLADKHQAITYGLGAGAEYQAVNLHADHGSFRFSVMHNGEPLGDIHLPLRGTHNVQNATAVVAMCHSIGIDFADIASTLGRFGGVARRFDVRGHHNGITLIDDYAHLPTEIAAVLKAARNSGDDWKRVVAIFQPNRYNRMSELWQDYCDAFVDADLVVLTDIYASGTTPIPGVTGKLVVNAVMDAHPRAAVAWLPRRSDLIDYLARTLRSGDVAISMGCGDIASLPSEVLGRWASLEPIAESRVDQTR